jgi:hypothetical protein
VETPGRPHDEPKRPDRARQGYISAVNDNGAAVGWRPIDNTHTRPVVWKPGSTKATVLHTETEYGGVADDKGTTELPSVKGPRSKIPESTKATDAPSCGPAIDPVP